MKITDITQQKKRSDRYSIYIDGEFALGLSQNDLVDLGLKIDQEITPQELEQYRHDSELGKAYDKALNYISIRDRSEKEINDYLYKKQYAQEIIKEVISKLENLGLIDDVKFVHTWIQWRASKLSSKIKIRQELMQKGIDSQIINEALASIDETEEVAKAKELADKYAYRYDSRQKLMAYMSRRGYSYDVIRQAIEDLDISKK